jgi:hypothetical protein
MKCTAISGSCGLRAIKTGAWMAGSKWWSSEA